MAACGAGLASGIEDALDLSPAQVIECLSAANASQARSEGNAEDFLAMAGAALGGADGVEIVRG